MKVILNILAITVGIILITIGFVGSSNASSISLSRTVQPSNIQPVGTQALQGQVLGTNYLNK